MKRRLELNIVVADDEPGIVANIGGMLEKIAENTGYKLRWWPAYSGSEVLDLVEEHKNELNGFILDFDFKAGINGEETLKAIDDPFERTFVIMVSGKDESSIKEVVRRSFRGRNERFAFIQKPVTQLMLSHNIDRLAEFLMRRPLPSLLAYPLSRLKNGGSSQSQVTVVKDFLEAVLISCSIILLADELHRGVFDPAKLPIRTNARITMGAWLILLRSLVSNAGKNPFVPELITLLKPPKKSQESLFRMIGEFKDQLRDPIVGHGITLDESVYEELAAPYLKKALDLATQLLFAADYPMITVDDSDYDAKDNRSYLFRSRLLMGTESPYHTVQWRSKHPLSKRKIYLWRSDGRTLSLDPFMITSACVKCYKEQVFFPIKIDNSVIEYQASCNHQISKSWNGVPALP
jgi:DNA-binding LytR/AlgR family response regulator